MPNSSTAIEEQLSRLQELAQARVNTALTSGTSWLADAGLDAIEKVRVLRATAKVNLTLLPSGGQLREHLGADWVDLNSDIYDLVLSIGRNLEA